VLFANMKSSLVSVSDPSLESCSYDKLATLILVGALPKAVALITLQTPFHQLTCKTSCCESHTAVPHTCYTCCGKDGKHGLSRSTVVIHRVGQDHIYTVYIRYFWQKNDQIYGHIRCIYTVLANPINTPFVTPNLDTPTAKSTDWPDSYSFAHTHFQRKKSRVITRILPTTEGPGQPYTYMILTSPCQFDNSHCHFGQV
jgi:hypothetical protein